MFPNAKTFERDYPSVAMARDGVLLIEVKALSDQDTHVNESNLSWSEDGSLLGFEVSEGQQRKILVKDLSSGSSKEVRVAKNAHDTFLEGITRRSIYSYNAGLRWSKNGKRYAFMSNGESGQYNIFVGSMDHQDAPITKGDEKNGFASWNQRTDEVAFVSAKTGFGDIYVSDLATRKEVRVTKDNQPDIFPEWSPSGSQIFYTSGDAFNHDIRVVERSGGEWSQPKNVTKTALDEIRPVVSPNGKHLAFYVGKKVSHSDDFQWDIAVVTLPALDLTDAVIQHSIIAKDVAIDLSTGPAWSPDSQKIFFVKRDLDAFNPIQGYELFSGRTYVLQTKTKMNRDILVSKLGVLSFRAQVGAWDKVFLALTNQGIQLQNGKVADSKIVYLE